MNVDTAEFQAIKAEALEVKALRRALVWREALIGEVERAAEQRGFERGRAGRHVHPRGGQHGQPLRLVAGGQS
jgi:hypothetical protein